MPTIETESATQPVAVACARTARRRVRAPAWSVPCALAAMLWHLPVGHAETLFDSLMGSWSGSGQIRYDDGQAEGIKCKAYYTGGGDKLRLAIRCQGSSTEVEIRGQLTAKGGKLSGSWEERTFNATGEASGTVTANKISLSISGGGFTGSMSVTSTGARQAVTISAEGIKMRSVNVTLGKS